MKQTHNLLILTTALLLGACSGSSSGGTTTTQDSGAPTDDSTADDTSTTLDAPADGINVDTTPPSDAGVRRLPCLGSSGLTPDLPADQYGALEGELVSLVPPGSHGCPTDNDHLHLQIDVGGKRYDVAVTINDATGAQPIDFLAKDMSPTGAAPPGWSSAGFDYVSNLGVHSTDFAPLAKADLLARLQTELAPVSKVSIHGKSYGPVGDGMHNVHRNGGGHDGAIIAHGIGAGGADHVLAFHFYNSSF